MRPELPMLRTTRHLLQTTPIALSLLAWLIWEHPFSMGLVLFALGMLWANLLWERAYARHVTGSPYGERHPSALEGS